MSCSTVEGWFLTSSSSSKSLSTSGRFSGTVCVSAMVSSRLPSVANQIQLTFDNHVIWSPSHHHELEVLLEAELPQLHAVSCSLSFHLNIEHQLKVFWIIVHLQIQQLLPLRPHTSLFHNLHLKRHHLGLLCCLTFRVSTVSVAASSDTSYSLPLHFTQMLILDIFKSNSQNLESVIIYPITPLFTQIILYFSFSRKSVEITIPPGWLINDHVWTCFPVSPVFFTFPARRLHFQPAFVQLPLLGGRWRHRKLHPADSCTTAIGTSSGTFLFRKAINLCP